MFRLLRIIGSMLVVALLDVTTVGAGSAQPVEATMISVRHAHLKGEDGGSGAGSTPLVGADGLVVETAPPVPTLLLGVRDASGFKGYADAAEGIDLSPTNTVMIGSQTKAFTAAAILQLDQEGVLSIKDSLADPQWADALRWPNAEAITIEMVLSHTSGIPDFVATDGFQKGMSDPSWAPTPEEILRFARDAEPTFAPGEGWHYSNTNYIILGVIIERVTGNAYAAELHTRFFEPLGLSHTQVYGAASTGPTMPSYVLWCENRAEPSAIANGRAETAAPKPSEAQRGAAPKAADGPPACPSGSGQWLPMTAPYDQIWPLIWAAGGILSTTEDMTRWITHLVATDDVLDPEHRKRMQTPVPQSKPGIDKQFPRDMAASMAGYGLGLIVFDYDIGTGYGHSGSIPGYASNSVYFPGEGDNFAITIVVGESKVEAAANGSNAIAAAIKATR